MSLGASQFWRFVDTCEKIRATTSKNMKVEIIRSLSSRPSPVIIVSMARVISKRAFSYPFVSISEESLQSNSIYRS